MTTENWSKEDWTAMLTAGMMAGIRHRVLYIYGDNDDAEPMNPEQLRYRRLEGRALHGLYVPRPFCP